MSAISQPFWSADKIDDFIIIFNLTWEFISWAVNGIYFSTAHSFFNRRKSLIQFEMKKERKKDIFTRWNLRIHKEGEMH